MNSMNNEYLHNAPSSRRFLLPVDAEKPIKVLEDSPLTLRCGLCGWTQETTREEFAGLHAKHRKERHA